MRYITNRNEFFPKEEVEKAIKHCQQYYPNEAGGIFDKDGLFIPLENLSDEPDNCFEVDTQTMYDNLINDNISCFIHSHINQNNFRASYGDQIAQRESGIPYGIISLRNGSCTHCVFFGGDVPTEPLLGRPFIYGIWDCLSLASDYWKQEYDYELPDLPRSWCFWYKGENMVEKFPKEIKQVPLKDIREGDFLMYKLQSDKINHLGVMGKGGKALHHFHNQVSAWFPISHNRKHLVRAYRL
jgi:proteasome lid subunit RPN8/RPN11